jgi:prevent-host-death family protein
LPYTNWLGKLVDMTKAAVRTREGQQVGAFEAKTHLAELLRQVEEGRSFEICRRGKPIARLVPPSKDNGHAQPSEVRDAFRSVRKRVSGRINIRALIEAGRRM